jgi:uncharacterized tellurite resistance protein B-like protein
MLERLLAYFSTPAEAPADRDRRARIAAAALLQELALADHHLRSVERQRILLSLQADFALTEAEAHALMDAAAESRKSGHSLHRLAAVVRETMSAADRKKVVAAMWKLAAVDGEIDANEEALMASFTALLGVDARAEADARAIASASKTVILDDE